MPVARICTTTSATIDAVSTLPIGGSSLRSGSTTRLVRRITACDSWLRASARASGSSTRSRKIVTTSCNSAPTTKVIARMDAYSDYAGARVQQQTLLAKFVRELGRPACRRRYGCIEGFADPPLFQHPQRCRSRAAFRCDLLAQDGG